MYRIQLASGAEVEYTSRDDFSAAVRTGRVGNDAKIFHQRAGQWLPIARHPHFIAALGDSALADPVAMEPMVRSQAEELRPLTGPVPAITDATAQSPAEARPPLPRPRKTKELVFLDVEPEARPEAAPAFRPAPPSPAPAPEAVVPEPPAQMPSALPAVATVLPPRPEYLASSAAPEPSPPPAPAAVRPPEPPAAAVPIPPLPGTPAVVAAAFEPDAARVPLPVVAAPAPAAPEFTAPPPVVDPRPMPSQRLELSELGDMPAPAPATSSVAFVDDLDPSFVDEITPRTVTLPPPPRRQPPIAVLGAAGLALVALVVFVIMPKQRAAATGETARTEETGALLVPSTRVVPTGSASVPEATTLASVKAEPMPDVEKLAAERAAARAAADSARKAAEAGEVAPPPVAIDAPILGAPADEDGARSRIGTLARGYAAAQDAAWLDFTSRLKVAGLDGLFAPGRFAPAALTASRASLATAKRAVADYRGRSGAIERAYRDTVSGLFVQQEFLQELEGWGGRAERNEPADAAQLEEALFRAAERVLAAAAAPGTQFLPEARTLSFGETAAAAEYENARTMLMEQVSRARGFGAKTPAAVLARALGTAPPVASGR